MNQMGNTIERCEVVNDLDGGGVKAVRLTDGRYVTEKLARELAMKLEEELDKWRHEHFHGKRDDHFSGEYLERTSQLELARYFAQWGSEHLATSGKTSGGSSEIPNYLNELADYARRQVEELLSVIKKYDDYSEEQIEELRTHLMAMFLEGAGWQKEQTPAWSEEDETIFDKALDAVYYQDCNDKQDVLYALKGLCDLISKKRKVIPVYQRWKPSEEQMKALQHAIDACESEWAYQDDELRSLLNDLKKL